MIDTVHNIHSSLNDLIVPIGKLRSLPGNPRYGAIGAIKESYLTFGQVKPIVGVPEEDGTITIVAGNQQFQAAQELGWTHQAVLVQEDWDHATALAFALVDNRTSELGNTDEDLLFEMLSEIPDIDPALMEALEWDPFEIALMETTYDNSHSDREDLSQGFTPPVIINQDTISPKEDEEDLQFTGDEETTKDVVTMGASVVDQAGAKTTFQYTLLFQSIEQQSRFYHFLRYLKGLPEMKDLTSTEQLLAYLESTRED